MNTFFLSLLQPQFRCKKEREFDVEDESFLGKKWNISIDLAKFPGVHPSLRVSKFQVVQAIKVYCLKPQTDKRACIKKWFYLNKVNRNLFYLKKREPCFTIQMIKCDQKLGSLLRSEHVMLASVIKLVKKHLS